MGAETRSERDPLMAVMQDFTSMDLALVAIVTTTSPPKTIIIIMANIKATKAANTQAVITE